MRFGGELLRPPIGFTELLNAHAFQDPISNKIPGVSLSYTHDKEDFPSFLTASVHGHENSDLDLTQSKLLRDFTDNISITKLSDQEPSKGLVVKKSFLTENNLTVDVIFDPYHLDQTVHLNVRKSSIFERFKKALGLSAAHYQNELEGQIQKLIQEHQKEAPEHSIGFNYQGASSKKSAHISFLGADYSPVAQDQAKKLADSLAKKENNLFSDVQLYYSPEAALKASSDLSANIEENSPTTKLYKTVKVSHSFQKEVPDQNSAGYDYDLTLNYLGKEGDKLPPLTAKSFFIRYVKDMGKFIYSEVMDLVSKESFTTLKKNILFTLPKAIVNIVFMGIFYPFALRKSRRQLFMSRYGQDYRLNPLQSQANFKRQYETTLLAPQFKPLKCALSSRLAVKSCNIISKKDFSKNINLNHASKSCFKRKLPTQESLTKNLSFKSLHRKRAKNCVATASKERKRKREDRNPAPTQDFKVQFSQEFSEIKNCGFVGCSSRCDKHKKAYLAGSNSPKKKKVRSSPHRPKPQIG